MTSPYHCGQASILSARHAATLALQQVMAGQSLNQVISPLQDRVDTGDQAFMRDMTMGSCRHFQRLNALAKILLAHPFDEADQDLHALLVVGLYQLEIQKKAPHAAVHASVDVCDELGKGYAKSVINACLRRYCREYQQLTPPLDNNPVTATSHPKWLVKMLAQAWPEDVDHILAANNQIPSLCLRVNPQQGSREAYLEQLHHNGIEACSASFSSQGIYLAESCDVTQLPGFSDGYISIQDEAAQLAAQLLQPAAGEYILDACAAPGGKTCALLEQALCTVTALDIDEKRLARVNDNLSRLHLKANVICGDMATPDDWWDGKPFDAILLDVPCSATGVIRRHPDIKLLRRRDDIGTLVELQQRLLGIAWRLLKPGGRLLYATCSVLPQENTEQIERFIAENGDSQLQSLDKPWGKACNAGRQLFPRHQGHDGFYYALIYKAANR